MIAGILEPESGQIFVNNVSLHGVFLNNYRALVGQSLPEESPFEGSIQDNLTFGDSTITMDRIYEVMTAVGLMDFVKEQPLGLKTILYPEGRQIPYTISKKIVLARSILHSPKLLVLKDPLDQFNKEDTEELMKYLTDPSHGWALVVVSSNPNWADRCGIVIRMENGKLIKN
jgi:ABC-type bacteriocin/lantibiotic exporter with double-glycine peptidase domain